MLVRIHSFHKKRVSFSSLANLKLYGLKNSVSICRVLLSMWKLSLYLLELIQVFAFLCVSLISASEGSGTPRNCQTSCMCVCVCVCSVCVCVCVCVTCVCTYVCGRYACVYVCACNYVSRPNAIDDNGRAPLSACLLQNRYKSLSLTRQQYTRS